MKIQVKTILPLVAAAFLAAGCSKKGSSPLPAPALSSDRAIVVTADNNSPAIGTNITFTLVAGNAGPDAGTGISVMDALPTGYSLVSAVATDGSYGSGTWNGFGLAKGATATLTIIATVNASGVYTNTATISGKESDPVATNNSSTITPTPVTSPGWVVSTLAGTDRGFVDGPGTVARFSTPRSVNLDAAGNLYVADHTNSCIRKISPSGIVSTLAGSGSAGFADGTGATAQFSGPDGVAVDAGGNVFVADAGNNCIRKITPAGVVSTYAGNNRIQGYLDGASGVAEFSGPYGVAVDVSGNVFVADLGNTVIRKITPGGTVSTLAGSGTQGSADGTGTAAQFHNPNGVATDAAGNVYVTDRGNFLVRKITPAGVVTTLAGSGSAGFADGTGVAANFEGPTGPCVDAAGNVYIADIGNNRIRKITPAGLVSTIAGGSTLGYTDGPVASALFQNITSIAVDAAGSLYVTDEDNNLIRKISH
jgi:uncharacterized repeat protein (TIGR01451 family)